MKHRGIEKHPEKSWKVSEVTVKKYQAVNEFYGFRFRQLRLNGDGHRDGNDEDEHIDERHRKK